MPLRAATFSAEHILDLFLLREHGALSTQEVAASLGAGPGTHIEWDDGWRILTPKGDPAPTDDP